MKALRTGAVAFALLATSAALSAHLQEHAKIVASDGVAGDAFGTAVSVSGGTIAVSSPAAASDTGAVYVFVWNGTDWVEEQKIVAADGLAGDRFGESVSVFGDRLLVGSPGHDAAGAEAGTAYVYARSAGVWTLEQKLVAAGALAADRLGAAVSLTDDTAVLGAPQDGAGGTATGLALVWRRSGAFWSEEATLTAMDAAAGDLFGCSVSLDGDVVLVGASNGDGLVTDSGAAYGFDRSGTTWTPSAKLRGFVAGDGFGTSVSLFQNLTAAVGAPGHDQNGPQSGAAYKYQRSPSGWVLVHKQSGGAGAEMGRAVSQDYRVTLAGATLGDGAAPDAGLTDLYVTFGSSQGADIYVSSDAATGDLMGTSVAQDVCWIVSGAPGQDTLGLDAGAAYVHPMNYIKITPLNGTGVNPSVLATTTPPTIGADWDVSIDATGIAGADSTALYGAKQLLPSPAPLLIGELLIDPSGGLYFIVPVTGSGRNTHTVTVPNNPWILGFDVQIQGAVRDVSSAILTLTNAETVRIGCLEED